MDSKRGESSDAKLITSQCVRVHGGQMKTKFRRLTYFCFRLVSFGSAVFHIEVSGLCDIETSRR